MKKELKKTLFKEVPVKILLTVYREGETYPTEVSYSLKGSYSHIIKTVSKLEEVGLLESKISGRRKVIRFTDKGEKVAELIAGMLEINENGNSTDEEKKVEEILKKIEEIYEKELKGKDGISQKKARNIGKRLGPYKRELGKLEGSTNTQLVDKARKRIDEIMELKNQLRE